MTGFYERHFCSVSAHFLGLLKVEICSLHLSGDGRLLCAGLRNAAGILLLLAEERMGDGNGCDTQ